ncbi:MAG TPA: hypothetical protein VGG39_37605 [Polyangiaceae bacterium]|jgi:hypothetical protein
MNEGWSPTLLVAVLTLVFNVWKEAPGFRLKTKLEILRQAKELQVLDESSLTAIRNALADDIAELTLGGVVRHERTSEAGAGGLRAWFRDMASAIGFSALFNVILVAHKVTLGRSWSEERGTAIAIELFSAFILLISARDAWRVRRMEAARTKLAHEYAERTAMDPKVSG